MGSIHLIRHGQASWGTDDYDRLSDRGRDQAGALGASWEASGWAPSSVVAGSMVRHAQTAITTIDTSGQGDGYDIDAGWDEYDHLAIAHSHDENPPLDDSAAFQLVLNRAIEAWRGGAETGGETYADFVGRIMGSFAQAEALAGPGRTVAVFTSGGPIAMVVSHLVTGDDSVFPYFNDVVFNASVTTIVVGRRGTRLLSFNEHTHLPKDLLTFR